MPGEPRHRTPKVLNIFLLALIAFGTKAELGHALPGAFQPSFEVVPCPSDVTELTEPGSVLSCGYLTVLEDRADPTEGTIRLFVVTAGPKTGTTLPDPIFIPGRDLVGRSPSSIPFGYRADRLVITMDRRGAGRSEPSLACPEVRQLTAPSTDLVLGSPQTESTLLDAVQRCHDRLTSEGINLD